MRQKLESQRNPAAMDGTFDLDGRLSFAVPKKGRIYDQSVALLKNIGIQVRTLQRCCPTLLVMAGRAGWISLGLCARCLRPV